MEIETQFMSSLQTAFRTLLFSSGVFLACAVAVVAALPASGFGPPIDSPRRTADAPTTNPCPTGTQHSPHVYSARAPAPAEEGRTDRAEFQLENRLPIQVVNRSNGSAPTAEPVELTGIDVASEDRLAMPTEAGPAALLPPEVDGEAADAESGEGPPVELESPIVVPPIIVAPRPEPAPRPQRRIFFEAAPETEDSDSRLEARLVSMERQLSQLVQSQSQRSTVDWQQATQLVQQLQQSSQLQNLERQLLELQRRVEEPPSAPALPPAPADSPEESDPQESSSGPKGPVLRAQSNEDNPERFSMQFQDAEITEVLAMLGELAGINILVGKDVTGKVPAANLQDVTIEQALEAILRSLGYVFERDGEFVFVMTAQEAQARKNLTRKLITKVYRPHYISVADLEALIIPLQTPEVGKIAKTTPSQVGIASSAESAGGDQLSQSDAIVVLDYPEVIAEIDQIVAEMDVPPQQVVIEAMILSVSLTDELEFGVNFALLNGDNDNLLVFGNGKTLNSSVGFPGTDESILPPMGEFIADAAGLKYGFLRGDVSGFIEALETISDTNLIASPQIRVLNKQKAELIIGEQLAYTTTTQNGTSSVENVNFLDVGTKLILRPFISSDGLVRMEIHPEQSAGVIDNRGLPNKTTTEVTTNVMVRDGTTVVIGGLIEEQVVESVDRVPLLGAIPLVGAAFRNKTERIERTELIVLITPRIVREPDAEIEGASLRYENERRHEHFRNELSPINRRNLARIKRERAEYYFHRGEYAKAHEHIEAALELNKNDLQALRLRDQIEAAHHAERHRWLRLPGWVTD